MRQTEPIYTPHYANGFSIEREKESGATLLRISNPWQGAEDILYHYDITKPAQRIVALSSSYVAMLDAVGCAERIVGISGTRFISTPSVKSHIERGEVAEIGFDSVFNFEQVKALGADLVLLYGVAGEAKMLSDKLSALGIPYIYIGDYLENNPLGKAEWVVAIAYICGVGEKGKEFFRGVEERYNALRNQKHCSAYHPRVMLNLPYRDTWFMPPHDSYMVQLIEDAGGTYILTENENLSTQSTPISLEEAMLLASKADFWINLGQISSKEELCAVAPRFAKVDAVRFGRIYNNNKRTTTSGGSDFWESGAVRPDIILADLVKILHHEAPTDSLYYYRRLE
ncbi:MAG: ABC transporter substrate-binding protein [Alistipes sp.]|nr:ABC transporter substrate-binding protein [Alistipes sp.]